MCGIAGIYNFGRSEPVNGDALRRMNGLLEHRGPDEDGFYLKGNIGLAMRRLSVIDLPTGRQPMASEDGRIQLVFNGEIYNFQELRKELISQGVWFKTNSDTEVVLRLYEREGTDCVTKLHGMFAFSIWDEACDRLMLARDRAGEKPLVYAFGNGRFAWASEIRALLQAGDISTEIDSKALDLYLGLQYIPSPWTIYSSIRKLPPAHRLILEKGQLRLERYWSLPSQPNPLSLSLDDTKKILRGKITDCVKSRMGADVPLGAFLSGGLDSTVVVGLMSQLSHRPVKTFSIGFEEEEYSELKYARLAADHFKTDHTEFMVKPQMSDVLPQLAKQFGEPFGDSSALPTYYLARETRKHVTVALTGDGGDENFAGYKRYGAMKAGQWLEHLPQRLRASLSSLESFLPRKGKRFMKDIAAVSTAARYLNWIGIFNESEKSEIYTKDFSQRVGPPRGSEYFLGQFFDQSQKLDPLSQLLFVDFSSYLPDCLMPKVDMTSMAHSLEARSPLLDHDLIEFASQISGNLKMKGIFSGKWILKETFKDFIPSPILNRSKMGFGLPVDAWFRGSLKEFGCSHLLSSAALNRGYFKKEVLEQLIEDHILGRRNNGYRLWSLLMLELWHLY